MQLRVTMKRSVSDKLSLGQPRVLCTESALCVFVFRYRVFWLDGSPLGRC
jgi:hypothetical protein